MNNEGHEVNYPALVRRIKREIDKFPKYYSHPSSVDLNLTNDEIEELRKKGFYVRIKCESYLKGKYECEVSWYHPTDPANPTTREAELIRDYAIAKSLDG